MRRLCHLNKTLHVVGKTTTNLNNEWVVKGSGGCISCVQTYLGRHTRPHHQRHVSVSRHVMSRSWNEADWNLWYVVFLCKSLSVLDLFNTWTNSGKWAPARWKKPSSSQEVQQCSFLWSWDWWEIALHDWKKNKNNKKWQKILTVVREKKCKFGWWKKLKSL